MFIKSFFQSHLGVWCTLFCCVIKVCEDILAWYAITLLVIFFILMLATLISIARQPRSVLEPNFTTPWTPFLPGVSILVNIYLMFQLDTGTWVRFAIWILIGLVIYFAYGVWYSHERPSIRSKLLLAESIEKVGESEDTKQKAVEHVKK